MGIPRICRISCRDGPDGFGFTDLMGAGYSSRREYADAVYKGLAFLIHQQKPNGSMQGNAKSEATYCHGMAALAMCSGCHYSGCIGYLSAERHCHTQTLQHPAGGWRYTEGDPGDLSQLGWQAMVPDSGIALALRSQIGPSLVFNDFSSTGRQIRRISKLSERKHLLTP